MKKDELLKLKSVIIAIAMTMSLSACQKDAKNQKYQVNYTWYFSIITSLSVF